MPLGSALLAVLCASLWGGLALVIRYTQDDLPPLGTAGLRFTVGSVFIYAWARLNGQNVAVRRDELPAIFIVGVMLFLQIGTFHLGMSHTSAALGALLIGTNPAWVVLMAHFALPGDRLSIGKLAGVLLAVLGLVALVGGPALASVQQTGEASTIGNLIVLLSSVLLGAKLIYTKTALSRQLDALKLILWSNVIGAAMLLAASGLLEGFSSFRFTPNAALGLLYQGAVVSGFCFVTWTVLLRHHRASQLAMFGFIQPLTGVVLGVLIRGDALTHWLGIGGALVVLGVYVVARAQQRLDTTPGDRAETTASSSDLPEHHG